MCKNSSRARLMFLLCLALQPALAFAYIDPNAGGLLLQLLGPFFAACVGGWVFMRKAVRGFVRAMWLKLMNWRNLH